MIAQFLAKTACEFQYFFFIHICFLSSFFLCYNYVKYNIRGKRSETTDACTKLYNAPGFQHLKYRRHNKLILPLFLQERKIWFSQISMVLYAFWKYRKEFVIMSSNSVTSTAREHVFPLFVKYVSANVLGMIGYSCYILADTFFVARGIGSMRLLHLIWFFLLSAC